MKTEKPFTFVKNKKGFLVLFQGKPFQKFKHWNFLEAPEVVDCLNQGYEKAENVIHEKSDKLLKHFGI